MNFESLFSTTIDDYVEKAFEPRQMLFYVHIPKCSGTSSVESLKVVCQHSWHFEFDKIDSMWERFLQRVQKTNLPILDMAAGHFWHWHIADLQNRNVPHHAITFLRHPIARLVSEYRYMCTPAHPPSKEFLLECPTFGDFVDKKVHDNAIASMLFNGVESLDDYRNRLRDSFRFIGLSEFYNLSMSILMEAIGKRYEPAPKMNVTQAVPENRIKVSDDVRARLHETQRLDIAIYQELYAKFATLADAFIGRQLEQVKETSGEGSTPHPATVPHEDS